MTFGMVILLILIFTAAMVIGGSIAHRISMTRTQRCMQRERKKYLEVIEESYHLAMENEKNFNDRMKAFDDAMARADEKLRQFAGMNRNQDSVVHRQRDLEERIADLIMNYNELSGRFRAVEDRILSLSRANFAPEVDPEEQAYHYGERETSSNWADTGPDNSQDHLYNRAGMDNRRLDTDSALDMGLGGLSYSVNGYPSFSGYEAAQKAQLEMMTSVCGDQSQGLCQNQGRLLDCEGAGLQKNAISEGFRDLQEGFEGDMKQTLKAKMMSIGADLEDLSFILDEPDEPNESDILASVIDRLNNSAPASGFAIRDTLSLEGRADNPGQQSRCSKIFELHSRGFSPRQISSHLDIPQGEVNIILRLRRHTERPQRGYRSAED